MPRKPWHASLLFRREVEATVKRAPEPSPATLFLEPPASPDDSRPEVRTALHIEPYKGWMSSEFLVYGLRRPGCATNPAGNMQRNADALKAGQKVSHTRAFRMFQVVRSVLEPEAPRKKQMAEEGRERRGSCFQLKETCVQLKETCLQLKETCFTW